jgi:hypothetical protein
MVDKIYNMYYAIASNLKKQKNKKSDQARKGISS